MSRILCTGGAGFIGSALCHRLLVMGEDLKLTDNGSRHGIKNLEQAGLRDGQCFGELVGDVRDPELAEYCVAKLGDTPERRKTDCVFHLAAINGTKNFYERPAAVLDVQIRGTQNVIDACVSHGVKTLALFSSSEVYQTPPVIPTPESVPLSIPDVINPRYSYAIGKIAAEAMAWWSAIEKVWVCRPHNVIGPNMGFEHVVPEMIRDMFRLPNGSTYAIKNPTAIRSFIYIDDFVDATMAIHEHVTAREGRVREIFHVGTEDMVTIETLAKKIAGILGKNFEWATAEGAPGGTPIRCPSITKVRSLGWTPRISLDEALERTVAAYLAKREEWPS